MSRLLRLLNNFLEWPLLLLLSRYKHKKLKKNSYS